MKVCHVPASPYSRKCRIAAAHLGLEPRVDFVDARKPAGLALRAANPLNKIPAALLDDGAALYDSRVILEYFDHLAGGGVIIPTEPKARFAVLTAQALADGIMDASILVLYESRYRESLEHSGRWLDMQRGKIASALAILEAAPPAPRIDAGTIALACALGFLDLRLAGAWRAEHPRLVAWLDEFAARVPSFEATRAAE